MLNRNFSTKEGDTFTVKGLSKDVGAVEDFYGAKGHIDVTTSSGNLKVARIANTETGTMDLQFEVDEGQTSFIEKIEIRGNSKTKDKVPLLGDLPLVGRLFRSESSQKSKKNLMIFVTPTIINPDGTRYHSDEEMPFLQSMPPKAVTQ